MRDNPKARQRGVLDNLQISVAQISDGSSNTIMIAEDGARREGYITNPAYLDPAIVLNIAVPDDFPTFKTRRFWRWAEEDNGYGVSGDPTPTPFPGGPPLNTISTAFKIVNNNNTDAANDGPVTCNWRTVNNCGANDEIFAFHPGGANVLFADGHVYFLKENANPVVVASLVSRSGGENLQDTDY
jgi:prepilin-type processing-associated H-X9-DG protein